MGESCDCSHKTHSARNILIVLNIKYHYTLAWSWPIRAENAEEINERPHGGGNIGAARTLLINAYLSLSRQIVVLEI